MCKFTIKSVAPYVNSTNLIINLPKKNVKENDTKHI